MNDLWKRRKVDVIGAALALVIAAGMIIFERTTLRPRREMQTCQSNLRQVGLAMMQYARDYDERYPLGNNWADALHPYSKKPAIFRCPSRSDLPHGYAMNKRMARASMADIYDPQNTVLGFDSDAGRTNPCDIGTSLPTVSRHPLGHSILFADAHVATVAKPDFVRGFDEAIIKSARAEKR